MHRFQRLRGAAYCICMALAVLIAAAVVLDALPPKPERYSAVHQSSGLPPLWGFSQTALVNTGDEAALDALPGVGEVIAQRIIDTRDMIGGFRLPEDLMLVKGIGEKTFAKIMAALEEPLVRLQEIGK